MGGRLDTKFGIKLRRQPMESIKQKTLNRIIDKIWDGVAPKTNIKTTNLVGSRASSRIWNQVADRIAYPLRDQIMEIIDETRN
jgi:hypothetical protein